MQWTNKDSEEWRQRSRVRTSDSDIAPTERARNAEKIYCFANLPFFGLKLNQDFLIFGKLFECTNQ